jgi:hypothetical protein
MNDACARRQAVALTTMLPEATEDARLVLKLALELVDGFLSGNQPKSDLRPAERNLFSISTGKALSSP